SGLALVSLITISIGSWFLSRLELDLDIKQRAPRKRAPKRTAPKDRHEAN
ncbi:MAG: hypothetical protein RL672_271, partial [Actinomycetota bacterium]